jgi:multiple antibiotic resistance protein
MNISLLLGSLVSLFSLINPLGALPVFISLTANQDSKWRAQQIRKTCIYIVAICIVSYFIGSYVLNFFGISINALKIAGGIIISRSGFLLLNAKHKGDVDDKMKEESLKKEDISFTPLAMPLLSGPGSISFLINLSIENNTIESALMIVASIFLVAGGIFAIFTLAPKVVNYIGQAGLSALSKIMGFLVLAIGIEMISASILNMLQPII